MIDIAEKFDRKRRRDGLFLGLAAGLIFGLVSQGINYLFLDGITLYQPPFGSLLNILLWMALGMLLGLTTCWASGSLFGVIIGSLVAGLMITASAIFSSNLNRYISQKLVGLIAFYLPFVGMAVPLLGLLRLAVNQQREWYELPPFAWKRLRLPLILLLGVAGLGLLWLYPGDSRLELTAMNRMIQSGLKAADPASLPPPLQDPLVGDFLQKATPGFTLQLDSQNLTRYQVPYIPMGDNQPVAIVARFSNRWTLVCLYITPTETPFCRGINNLEQFMTFGDDQTEILNSHGIYVPIP